MIQEHSNSNNSQQLKDSKTYNATDDSPQSSSHHRPPLQNPSLKNDDSSLSDTNDRSNLRQYLDIIFPVRRHELAKFFSITLLMFCILGIQNLIRATKDSVVITMIGAETISFLKFWGVMPSSFLIMILYVKLVSTMKAERIFYLIMGSFLIFFALFAFYLYPHNEIFHFSSQTTNSLIQQYPHFKWFILLLSNWSFSLFYIIAELWPNAVFALLFWQFVNRINTVDESKRFYLLFGLIGQTGLIISGTFLENIEQIDNYLINRFSLNTSNAMLTTQLVIGISLILGIIALITFWFINHKVLDISTSENLQFKAKKKQITLRESFKMIAQSRYIRLIAILLICYGVAINLVEGPWKNIAQSRYPDNTAYTSFVGNYLKYTGFLTITLVIIGSNIVRKLGWFAAAIITPIVMLVSGGLFFLIANFDSAALLMMTFFMLTDPIMIAISIGAIQNILVKSTKYTLFDATKEMSYVPLDDDLKTKGKAAADMVGTKLGKSLSAFLQSIIFVIIPTATYNTISIYLMFTFIIILCVWIWAVIELNTEYKNACNKSKNQVLI